MKELKEKLLELMPNMIVGGRAIEILEQFIEQNYVSNEEYEDIKCENDNFRLVHDSLYKQIVDLKHQLSEARERSCNNCKYNPQCDKRMGFAGSASDEVVYCSLHESIQKEK